MFIDNHRHRFSVVKMALRLGVSVSSYYDCHQLYGSRRLAVELITDHGRLSHTTVAKYMRQMGLRSKFYRKYRTTTDSKHSNMVAENLLDRNFSATAPNQAWVSDITYVSVIDGFEYLTTVIDLYDRKVVGYSISSTMKASDTVIPALRMAIKARLRAVLLF